MAATKKKAPWKRSSPKSEKQAITLTAADKAKAKRRAKQAGRPYPNLVDNMSVAAGKKADRSTGSKKPGTRKQSAKKK